MDATLAELDLMLAALGSAAGRMVPVLFAVIDQGARLYPARRGRSLHTADEAAAQRYVRAVLARPGTARELVRRLASLVVMCYYEQPEVKEEIGYRPDPYLAEVTRRRLELHGAGIAAAHARALAARRAAEQS